MRILQINNFARVTGGADRHCLELAALLRERGHEVKLLATADPANSDDQGWFVSGSVTRANRDTTGLRGQSGAAARALWNPAAAAAAREAIDGFRPDVIHAHKLYPQLSVAPLEIARRVGVPVVQTLHDYELIGASHVGDRGGVIDRHDGPLANRVLNTATWPVRRLAYRRAVSAWVAISPFVAAAHRRHGIESTVIENFVLSPESPPPPFAARSGAVHLGWLSHLKGLDTVLAAAARLSEIPFAIAGNGDGEAVAAAAARKLPGVSFLGRLDPDQATGLLARARVCLVPSVWQEPGGLAALEAMAAGTPVIASRVGGLAEYVAGAGNPVVDGLEELVDACRLLCTDEDAWRAHSEAGLQGMAVRHSPSRYAERIEDVYERARQTI